MEPKPFFRWGDHYLLGVEEIDRQHQDLVGLLNGIHEAVQSGEGLAASEPLLRKLVTDVRKHFQTEEKLMRESGYPRLKGHRADHNSLARKLQTLQRDLRIGQAELSEPLLGELKDWLRDHMLLADKPFGSFLKTGD